MPFNSSPRLGAGGVIATIIGLALVGIGTQAATPAAVADGVQIFLRYPQPGDTLLSGTIIVMRGIAYDTAATSGSGVSSATIYLGDRNEGGIALGIALLGQPSPQAGPGTQFANAGFMLRTPPIPEGSGSRTIFVYARSSVTNIEGVLQVPIFLTCSRCRSS